MGTRRRRLGEPHPKPKILSKFQHVKLQQPTSDVLHSMLTVAVVEAIETRTINTTTNCTIIQIVGPVLSNKNNDWKSVDW